MADFPKLIPAFTTHIVLSTPISIGTVENGGPVLVAPFTSSDSFLRSEPDYPIKVDAVYAHGSDFIRKDPDGKHVRLNVTAVLNDQSGAVIGLNYTGVIKVTPGVAAVLGGSADAKTTSFGDACTFSLPFANVLDALELNMSNSVVHMVFETGSEKLREIEQNVYVGTGRFIIEKDQPVVVEYKISQVAQ
jgi:hypothetical protein